MVRKAMSGLRTRGSWKLLSMTGLERSEFRQRAMEDASYRRAAQIVARLAIRITRKNARRAGKGIKERGMNSDGKEASRGALT